MTLALVTGGAQSMPYEPNQQGRDDRRAKDDPERSFCEIAARRLLGKLPGDEFKIAFDQGEVGSRLIDRPQLYDVFVLHIPVMPAEGCLETNSQAPGAENPDAACGSPMRSTVHSLEPKPSGSNSTRRA